MCARLSGGARARPREWLSNADAAPSPTTRPLRVGQQRGRRTADPTTNMTTPKPETSKVARHMRTQANIQTKTRRMATYRQTTRGRVTNATPLAQTRHRWGTNRNSKPPNGATLGVRWGSTHNNTSFHTEGPKEEVSNTTQIKTYDGQNIKQAEPRNGAR